MHENEEKCCFYCSHAIHLGEFTRVTDFMGCREWNEVLKNTINCENVVAHVVKAGETGCLFFNLKSKFKTTKTTE